MIPGGVHCEGDTALALGPQVEDNLILTREAETEGQGDTDCLGAGAQWTLTREQAGPQPPLQRLFLKWPIYQLLSHINPAP